MEQENVEGQQFKMQAYMYIKPQGPPPEDNQSQQQSQLKTLKDKNASFFEFQDDEQSKNEKKQENEINSQSQNLQNPSEQSQIENEIEQQLPQDRDLYEERNKDDKFSIFSITVTIILKLIWNTVILYPFMALDEFFFLIKYIFSCKCSKRNFLSDFVNPIFCIIFSFTIVYVCYETIKELLFDEKKENVYFFWYIDGFIMFITHTMIFSIIQMTKKNDFSLKFKNIFSLNKEDEDVLFIHIDGCFSTSIMDTPIDNKQWLKEYQRIIFENLEVDVQSQRFNCLVNFMKNLNIKQYIGFQLVKGQNKFLSPCSSQFLTLSAITFLKIVFCVYYIFLQQKTLNLQDLFHISVITLFSINEVYCLNCMLSSYDLRRKTIMSNNINQAIKLYGDEIDYMNAIDVTCAQSLETWDNSRRAVYDYYQEILKKLEWTYTCLFFYYLFVFNITIAAYGEIYIVINKESILLKPLTVISSTFTFILLNTLILFRIYFGSKYNDVFDETSDQIDSIASVVSDMEQLYDYYFKQRGTTKQKYLEIVEDHKIGYQFKDEQITKQIDNQHQIEDSSNIIRPQNADHTEQYYKPQILDKSSFQKQNEGDLKLQASSIQLEQDYQDVFTCYDILCSKIMFVSDFYIQNQQQFQGVIYQKYQENILQQKILKNILKSLKNIQKQLIQDSKLKCYYVFNLLKLNFQETFFTIALGLLTLIPQIITKFIEQFQQHQQNTF
ncbi:transmembrane protein, putative (macronuclear) [Tetrahymena thermophila SB210]|uniref:Transmembrane protein, putative n=1 Tax=Tetrahymena thermophila (strain SB210) TaxID=312017 RepID=I7M3X0_TETTS|nr:transmembrane protein, putative [Tetrahymena thermophila SB210]EAS04453.2 transmembrane protein, putative [Tetrahymena thermophila SB210]|eukprot:XP_001024698.2 transmembrane protein, putative [Tetrahymena thermophila SB210]